MLPILYCNSLYWKKLNKCQPVSGRVCITHNGPAIRGVCVAERTEAVGRKAASGQSPGTAVVERSMARFLESWYKAAGLYECRGTNELSE